MIKARAKSATSSPFINRWQKIYQIPKQVINIARGTTDPGYWVYDLNHFANLQIWKSSGATCISHKFDHQMASLALPFCLGLPYWYYQLVLSWYLHQPESHQLSLKKLCMDLVTSRPIDRTPGIPGSDINATKFIYKWHKFYQINNLVTTNSHNS